MKKTFKKIEEKIAEKYMIFKRNAKGLLERETTTPVYHAPKDAPAAPRADPYSIPAPIATIPDKQDLHTKPQVANAPSSSATHYPQEDFPNLNASTQSLPDVTMNYNDTQEFETIEQPETTLGEGVSFKGELNFQRYLCIDGEFEGVLNSSGKLRVGKSGWVKSNLKLQSAVIEGRVEGDIHVEDLLELRGSARVQGNITARYLRVDDGVTLMGHVNINPHPNNSTDESMVAEPQL